jgi:hypothetical protein
MAFLKPPAQAGLFACLLLAACQAPEPMGVPGAEGLPPDQAAIIQRLPEKPAPVTLSGEYQPETGGVSVTSDNIRERGPMIFCAPEVQGTTAELATAPDGTRLVRVAQAEPCSYQLVRVGRAGDRELIDESTGAFYNALAVQVPEGALVLWTQVIHDGWLRTPEGRLYTTTLDPVLRARVRRSGGEWGPITTVVDLAEPVWLASAAVDAEGRPLVRFWRDSLYEHLLFDPEGRPETDGLYAANLQIEASAAVAAEPPVQIRDYRLLATNTAPPFAVR